jgi:FixJ family two-component response regulator
VADGKAEDEAVHSTLSPTVFVVDDDISVRESLELLLQNAGWRAVVCASGVEFLSRSRVPAPGCLILDVTLPDLDGFDLQKLIADRGDLPIIFLTAHNDVPMTVRAMKAGAVEYLTKPFDEQVLLAAVRQAIDKSSAAVARESEIRTLRDCYASLSQRERQVMALVVSGLLNKQVGAELGISEVTVKAHRGMVMKKMQAPSLPDLVNRATRLGLAPAAQS